MFNNRPRPEPEVNHPPGDHDHRCDPKPVPPPASGEASATRTGEVDAEILDTRMPRAHGDLVGQVAKVLDPMEVECARRRGWPTPPIPTVATTTT